MQPEMPKNRQGDGTSLPSSSTSSSFVRPEDLVQISMTETQSGMNASSKNERQDLHIKKEDSSSEIEKHSKTARKVRSREKESDERESPVEESPSEPNSLWEQLDCNAGEILDVEIKEESSLSEDGLSPEDTEWQPVYESKRKKNKKKGASKSNEDEGQDSRCRLTLKLKKNKKKPSSSPGSFGCDVCGALFSAKNRLNVHKKFKHRDESSAGNTKMESCDICGSEFQDLFRLNLHKRHKHLIQVSLQNCEKKRRGSSSSVGEEAEAGILKEESSASEDSNGEFSCIMCSSKFSDKEQLKEHRRIKHKEEFKEHEMPCNFCARTFNNAAKLKAHYDRHFREKLKWSIMRKDKKRGKKSQGTSSSKEKPDETTTAATPGGLEAGVKFEGPAMYQCDLCGVSFPKEYRLRLHKRFKHLDERGTDLVCELCGRGFKRPYSLKLHLMRHLGEKPYQCELCGKQAASSGDLKKHTILHTGVKPYQCNLCHKSFAYKNILNEHMNTHTGARPYLCDICGKAFSHYRTFGNHHRLHTGNTPYVCTFCGKKFAQLTGFNYHKKHHHTSNTSENPSASATKSSTSSTSTTPSSSTSSSRSKKAATVSTIVENPAMSDSLNLTSLSSEIIDRIPSMVEESEVPFVPPISDCSLINLPDKLMMMDGFGSGDGDKTIPISNLPHVNQVVSHLPTLYPPFPGAMPYFRHPY